MINIIEDHFKAPLDSNSFEETVTLSNSSQDSDSCERATSALAKTLLYHEEIASTDSSSDGSITPINDFVESDDYQKTRNLLDNRGKIIEFCANYSERELKQYVTKTPKENLESGLKEAHRDFNRNICYINGELCRKVKDYEDFLVLIKDPFNKLFWDHKSSLYIIIEFQQALFGAALTPLPMEAGLAVEKSTLGSDKIFSLNLKTNSFWQNTAKITASTYLKVFHPSNRDTGIDTKMDLTAKFDSYGNCTSLKMNISIV